ncbi:delta 1-pyrroline-5-carboxylate reductase [Sporothrix curviconia]|uniref:Delta 1-pyrroline-5-carboxylate reductase n=1 Tax=Sporothrix curviconia TaxID=1260050 RepID=A0ABP0BXJ7_9PEZI
MPSTFNLPIVGANNSSAVMSSASSVSSTSPPDHLTLAVLGCGSMGIAILSGILKELSEMDAPRPLQVVTSSASVSSLSALYSSHASTGAAATSSGASAGVASAAARNDMPERLPTHFLACVRRPEAAKRLRAALWAHSSVVKVVVDDNVAAVQQAGVALLACQASEAAALLSSPGMARALQGKMLISICEGVTTEQIESYLYGEDPASSALTTTAPATATSPKEARCRVVRAMPNAASLIGESMTVVDTSSATGPLPADAAALVTWIFRRIGSVVHHPSRGAGAGAGTRALTTVDRVAASSAAACTALGAAGPAFFALVLEAAIDGAVAMGLPRAEAQLLAAQSMRGAAGLVLQNGEHPALLRDRISSPGGCAIQGLLALEEGGVRSTVARAVREATAIAVQEGK